MTHHVPDYERRKWGAAARFALRLGERFGCRRSDAVIALSRPIQTIIAKTYRRIAVYIPNGVDLPEPSPPGPALAKLGLTPGRYVLAVGRLVPEKGFHDLRLAFRRVETSWRLAVVGGADHDDEYSRGLIARAGEDARVVLPGVSSPRRTPGALA